MPMADVNTETATRVESGQADGLARSARANEYRAVLLDSPSVLTSLWDQIRQSRREPRVTVPREYYRGEVHLPVSEMHAWYQDLPATLKQLPELSHYYLLRAGRKLHLLPKSMEVPDIWQDFQQQPGSWLNSLLVHLVVLAALVLPYLIARWLHPPKKVDTTVAVVDISPYLPDLPHDAKKAGGGGGGGDRSMTPASRGNIPKFAKEQFTPPVAKIIIPEPKLPVTPTLIGPPDLKMPQMASSQFGDPKSLATLASNGPGSGGGIGTGSNGGVGSGNGRGLGPGDEAGVGGGVYDIGGNVTAPVGIYEPEPQYSEEARKAKYSGTVVVEMIVDSQGNVREAQVMKSVGLGLDEKALEAVRTWKFKPGLKNGVPVATRVSVEVYFRLL
jgi:periplasmic protein TonB